MDSRPLSLSIVVVLYNVAAHQSTALKTVVASALANQNQGSNSSGCTVLAVDNSTNNVNAMHKEGLLVNGFDVAWLPSAGNIGLARAYNRALKHIGLGRTSANWFCTLDQDTSVPLNFVSNIFKSIENIVHPNVAVLAPLVQAEQKQLSPMHYWFFKSFPASSLSLPDREHSLKNISFFNTGLVVRNDLFVSLGMYQNDLFLDFVDHEWIGRAAKAGYWFRTMEITLQQQFSALEHDFDGAVIRFSIFLKDHSVFSRLQRGAIGVNIPVITRLLALTWQYKSLVFWRLWRQRP